MVSVDARRQLKINQDPTTLSELGPRLEDIFKTRNDRVMFVKGDPNVAFRRRRGGHRHRQRRGDR